MFRKDIERTPQERARRAQFSIVARLGGCGYLVYLMIQLLNTPAEERTTLMIVLSIILLAGSVVVICFTIYDLIIALKTGRFNPAMYEDLDNCASQVEKSAEDTESSDQASLEAPNADDAEENTPEDDDTENDDPEK